MPRKKKIARQDKIASDINARFTKSKAFQNNLFSKFNDYYRIYRGKLDNQKQAYEGRARLFINFCYSTVETILPRMVANRPKIEIAPRKGEAIESSTNLKKVLDYFWDVINMRRKLKQWVKQMLLYGVGVVRTGWDFRAEQGIDCPKVEPVDLFDWYVDPFASTLEDADYVIQVFTRDIEEVKANPRYKNTEKLSPETEIDENKELRISIGNLISRQPSDRKKVKIVDYWGKYDLNGDGLEEESHIVISGSTVLLEEPNPYIHGRKPFVVITDNDLPNEFWAIGEVEPLESLQYELNDVRNQRMDNVTQILHKMWKVLKGADVDEDELVFRPNGIVHTGDMEGLEPIITPDVTMSAYNEETLIKQDFEKISGVVDYGTGVGATRRTPTQTTATGMALQMEVGNQRLIYKLDNIEEGIKELGEQLVALIQQYLTSEVAIRITGEKGTIWQTVLPEDIQGQFDIFVEAGSTLPSNKIIQRQEAREALATVAPFAQIAGINLKYFIKKLLESYDWQNLEEAFISEGQSGIPGQPTPASTGIPLAGLEGLYGTQGKTLGGTSGPPEIGGVPRVELPPETGG